jgi:hypothetical protein
VDITHGSASRADESLTKDDHQALEAIRRQLDTEFAHFSEPAPVMEERPVRRRRRVGTMLGLLLASASACAVTAVFVTVHQALKTAPMVGRQIAAPAPGPAPVTHLVAAARPAETPAPASRVTASTAPKTEVRTPPPPPRVAAGMEAPVRREAPPVVVPDVVRSTETPSRDTMPAAFITVAPGVTPPVVQQTAAVAPASSPPSRSVETPAAAQSSLPLVQAASDQIHSAWVNVRERVTSEVREHLTSEHFRAAWATVTDEAKRRPSGKIAPAAAIRPEAP